MAMVKSKYKNPDRFIKKLEARARDVARAWTNEVARLISKIESAEHQAECARGEKVVSWESGIFDEQGAESRNMGDFKVDNTIAIIGKVISVVEVRETSTDRVHSSIKYRRLETRRIQDD